MQCKRACIVPLKYLCIVSPKYLCTVPLKYLCIVPPKYLCIVPPKYLCTVPSKSLPIQHIQYSEKLGSTFQQIEHSDCSIHITTYSPNTTTVFESDTDTEPLITDFHIPTLSSIVPFGNIFDQELDTNSINELVLNQTTPVGTENLKQINLPIFKTTITIKPENQANNNDN
ncbi:1334_t:CDS:2 [Dentiscutata heterogama]|uniref:1334_t:CDS:1 n=1 Tax=Dentiscutata heterogama TaxID=1316150 RepID=A0ACA9LTK1_9GLOM|nr:1334_t:CDS:2 [Dentiscutata heterogama]